MKEAIQTVIKHLENEIQSLVGIYRIAEKERYTNRSKTPAIQDAVNTLLRAVQILRSEVLEEPEVPRQETLLEEEGSIGPNLKTNEQNHESFGVVEVGQISGVTKLVGSMVEDLPVCVEMSFYRATRVIDPSLHTERYRNRDLRPLLTVRMSVHQWALMISNLNRGEIPCTISSVDGVTMSPVPREVLTPMGQIAKDASTKAQNDVDAFETVYLRDLEALEGQIQTSGLAKKRQDELLKSVQALRDRVSGPRKAAEWAARRLAEDSAATVAQARVEIAATLEHLIHQAGVAALENREDLLPQLPGVES